MGLGLVFCFQGLAASSVGVVALLIALGAGWPLFYDVIDGALPCWCGLG